MKNLLTITLAMFLMVSCGPKAPPRDIKTLKSALKVGMAREEVTSAIGKPDYSIDESRPGRAVKGSYLFEYRQGKQVMFVSFKQDKVTKLRYFVEP